VFFNAHTYYSIQSSEPIEPLRIFGAFLPDSALTGVMGWTDLHDKEIIEKFGDYIGDSLDERQLLLGLQDHYRLDLRSHEAFEDSNGYAFSHQTPELVQLVLKACRIESHEQARRIAHNFIESGVDINLLTSKPEIQTTFRAALQSVDVSWVAMYVANFFDKPLQETTAKLNRFVKLSTKYELESTTGWEQLWEEICQLLLGHTSSKDDLNRALILATQLTITDFAEVLAV
jgi:hypothetical protein